MKPVACIYFPKGVPPETLSSLGEALGRFSSQVALRAGEAAFVETGKSALLYSQAHLELRFQFLARRYPSEFRMAFGQNAAEALALARFNMQGTSALPLEALLDYASPFQADDESVKCLLPLIHALKDLGLKDLGALLGLRRQQLGARFGADAALLLERVEGRFPMAWPRFEKRPSLKEACALTTPEDPQGCENLQGMVFQLKIVTDRLGARLRGRGLRAAGLRLLLHLDRAPERRMDMALALPQGAPSELLKILRQRLESEFERHPLRAPALQLFLEVTETAPGFPAQAHFFDKKEEEAEAWNSLVTRLSQRLGPDQVFLAELIQSYLPERAWRRVIKEPVSKDPELAATPLPERPNRWLSRPLPLKIPLKHWSMPERIQSGWWDDALDRDYYQVENEEGRKLWVFTQAGSPRSEVWLQGYFD